MKKLIIVLLTSAIAWTSHAQQESLHSHLFENHSWQNPAAAGASDFHQIRFNHRMQWMRMVASPKTATFSYNGAFRRVGLGARIQYDNIASFERIRADIAYAYHIPITQKLKLSVGLNFNYFNYRLGNANDLGLVNAADIAVINGQQGSHAFDMGAGLYLYSKRLFVGVSAINLIQWQLNFGEANRDSEARLYRQYQAMAGYKFTLGKEITLTPSLYFRYVQAAQPQFDINVKVGVMDEKVFFGVTYRTTMDFAAYLGFRIKDMVYLGYSFEFSASNLQQYTGGTHEITLGVDIVAKKEKPKQGEVKKEVGDL